MTDAIPTHIGKYQIVELVGEGAMGTVYRAVDSVIGRTVAIKVMNASIAREKDHRQRFLREAQAAGSLQHPNVVTIYDLGELDGHLFIAMEFVHGADLEKLMSLTEPLKLQSKLDIIVDVLMGLSYAHKHGIVHRDIKPANIRVGEDGRAKIMDFGVAHLASSDMTRTGIVVGTPSYMAPEQVTGGKTVPQTDIFAVGALLYHLLSGTKPFEGPTLQSLFYRIVTDMPRPMGELKPGLPPALDRITQKAMAKDPAQRYANALDMANEIIAVRSELSGNAYPASSASLTAAAVSIASSPGQQPAVAAKPSRRIQTYAGMAAAAAVVAVAWLALGQGSRDGGANSSPSSTDSAMTAATPPPAPERVAVAANPQQETSALAVTAPPAPPAAAPEEPRAEPRRTTSSSAEAKKAAKKAELTQRARDAARAEEQRKRGASQKPAATTAAATIGVSSLRVTEPSPRVTSPGTQAALVPPPVRIPETRTAVIPPPAPVVRESVSPPPAPPPAPAPREAVASAVQSYARAIESRDIGAVRRAYPGISGDQARGFEQFFQASRSINVSFRVASLETIGNTADAKLVGTYEYVTASGKSERQPVSFDATLRYDGSAWRLTSVR